jgi:hypothetical protein
MNLILITLMFIAIILVVVGFIKATQGCPPRKIEYRYVPRSFIEDQQEPVPVTDIFAKMFFESTPFMHESGKTLPPPSVQQLDINKNFISQS